MVALLLLFKELFSRGKGEYFLIREGGGEEGRQAKGLLTSTTSQCKYIYIIWLREYLLNWLLGLFMRIKFADKIYHQKYYCVIKQS